MEGVTSGRRPGQEHRGRPGRSHREHEKTYSKGNPSTGARGDDWHHYDKRKKIADPKERSHSKGAVTRQSRMAKSSRHSWGRSPDDSLPSGHKEKGRPEGKVKRRLSPAQGSREDKPNSTRAGHRDKPGFARPPLQLNGRRIPPRSPGKTTRPRCQDRPACRSPSPKRRRQHRSPEAPDPQEVLMSRLFNQAGALDVGLEELRAPGGAFLPVPASGPQIGVSQRAWLSWQLAHTGANLHWALVQLDALLASQLGAPASSQR